MGYAKYVLSKTGWFPQWKPNVAGVLEAARKVFEIKDKENGYYYIFPDRYAWSYLHDLVEIFASNGVILRPYKSRHYNCWVFRVPNNGQKFIRDVKKLNDKPNDDAVYNKVAATYEQGKQKVLFPHLVNKIKRR